jgi:hypothetical protein
MRALLIVGLIFASAACSEDPGTNGTMDAAKADSGNVSRDADPADADRTDANPTDADSVDAGEADAEPTDADQTDADQTDAEPTDAELMDAEPTDAESMDAENTDAVTTDAGNPDTGASDGGVEMLNDEFDDPSTFSNWNVRDMVEGTQAQYSTLDIATSTPGNLTIIPDRPSYWEAANRAIFIYKLLAGDFIMHASLRVGQVSNINTPPSIDFNSAGLMARNAASSTTSENWTLITMGYQATTIGTRDASTFNNMTNISSFRGSTQTVGELVLCRIGPNFYTYYTTPNKGTWVWTDWFVRNDLPASLQVGIAAEANGTQPHMRAEFDWIRFGKPSVQSDCTMNLPPN